MGLKKTDNGYIFQSGPYTDKSLDEVLEDWGGRGWLLSYAVCAYSREDSAIIQRELKRWYINDQRSVLAECKVCGDGIPHNAGGCVLCQSAELEA